MSDLDDEVVVGNYVFWGFRKAGENVIYFLVRRLDEGVIRENDKEKVESIFGVMDLWEDTLSLVKAIWPEISHDGRYEGRLEINYHPDKYNVERGTIYFNQEERKLAYGIKFSPEEALRQSRGMSESTAMDIDYLKERLDNANKWLMLSNIRRNLLV